MHLHAANIFIYPFRGRVKMYKGSPVICVPRCTVRYSHSHDLHFPPLAADYSTLLYRSSVAYKDQGDYLHRDDWTAQSFDFNELVEPELNTHCASYTSLHRHVFANDSAIKGNLRESESMMQPNLKMRGITRRTRTGTKDLCTVWSTWIKVAEVI